MKNGFSVLIILVATLLITLFQPVLAEEIVTPSEDSPTGKLKIDSQFIEHLVLVDDRGQSKEFEKPADILNLPPGKYRLQQVKLIDQYEFYAFTAQGLEWITISPDKMSTMKFGPPLTQSITLARQGSVIELDYKLTGQGGENYTSSNRDNAPGFAVYKGDKEITSGKFEYG